MRQFKFSNWVYLIVLSLLICPCSVVLAADEEPDQEKVQELLELYRGSLANLVPFKVTHHRIDLESGIEYVGSLMYCHDGQIERFLTVRNPGKISRHLSLSVLQTSDTEGVERVLGAQGADVNSLYIISAWRAPTSNYIPFSSLLNLSLAIGSNMKNIPIEDLIKNSEEVRFLGEEFIEQDRCVGAEFVLNKEPGFQAWSRTASIWFEPGRNYFPRRIDVLIESPHESVPGLLRREVTKYTQLENGTSFPAKIRQQLGTEGKIVSSSTFEVLGFTSIEGDGLLSGESKYVFPAGTLVSIDEQPFHPQDKSVRNSIVEAMGDEGTVVATFSDLGNHEAYEEFMREYRQPVAIKFLPDPPIPEHLASRLLHPIESKAEAPNDAKGWDSIHTDQGPEAHDPIREQPLEIRSEFSRFWLGIGIGTILFGLVIGVWFVQRWLADRSG